VAWDQSPIHPLGEAARLFGVGHLPDGAQNFTKKP
jgi:hypothetical protein